MTSDAGVMLLKGVDERLGLVASMTRALGERRQAGKIQHGLEDLLRQRVFQICCGWEDANDADFLRFDPAFQAALGRVPGEQSLLASQPTISRLEEGVCRRDVRTMAEVLLDAYIARLRKAGRPGWKRIILDIDSTDDPTHGNQQLTMFHGYYDQWQFLPLLVFDQHGWPIASVLRPGNAHDSWGTVAILRRIIARIWEEFPKAKILLRADDGFAFPDLYEFCEQWGIPYVIGQITNDRLKRRGQLCMIKAQRIFQTTGKKAKLFGEFRHRAGSWHKPRRIVTNMDLPPEEIYRFYTDRGQMENRIKDLKNGLSADRLSCHRFLANQFRLLLHTVAYALMFCLREMLAGTPLATAQMDTLRLRLLKLGARVVVSARRIWFHLATACPSKNLWNHLVHRLARAPA